MIKGKYCIVLFLIFFYINNIFARIPSLVDLENGISVYNGHIVYPCSDSNFLNIVEIGPGQSYEEIHNVPISDFTENTLVKIYYRAEPYRTKTLLEFGGTENIPLRIQGIPDANGNLPVVSAENATLHGNFNQWTEDLGVFVVCGPYGQKPVWIEFVNLHIKDGEYAGIWSKGDHISVKGCILEDNPNGIFFQATNQILVEISTYNLIEGCRFVNNGDIGSWFQHNIYSQGCNTTIQFNTIENLQDSSFGSSLKDRSSHTVIRYNYIETSARTIDLVEPEDADQVVTQDEDWDNVYVYGNLIFNTTIPFENAGTNMIHYGYDNTDEFCREGTLFVINNTIIIDRDDSQWRLRLFDVNSFNSLIDFTNNILTAEGLSNFYIFRSNQSNNAGNIDFGISWISVLDDDNDWDLNENAGNYTMIGENNIITGSDPGFTNPNNNDYTLIENSACWEVGENINSSLSLLIDFNPITNINLEQRSDQTLPNLGCFGVNATSSIPENNYNINILVFPNPTKGIITISGDYIQRIDLINVSGQIIRTITTNTNQLNMNLNRYSRGLYFLKILTTEGEIVKKIVIQ